MIIKVVAIVTLKMCKEGSIAKIPYDRGSCFIIQTTLLERKTLRASEEPPHSSTPFDMTEENKPS